MSVEAVRPRGGSGEPGNQSLLLPGDWNPLQQGRPGGLVEPVGTHWVERDVLGVAQEVAQRWPNLRVASCSCNRCHEQGHYPHVVVELCRDGKQRPVFGFSAFGRHIIERLEAIHVANEPDKQAEKANEQAKKAARKQTDDKRRADLEVIEAALRSPKIDWKGPGGKRADAHARIT